jgi:toxin HigB-1
MIRSFKCKETEKIFNRQRSQRLDQAMQRVAYRKLRMLHRARSLIDLRSPPSNHLEKLKGDRAGQHSIRINDRYRICFDWVEDDAFNVEIVDYH